jgi:hypothetical protein
MAPLSANSLIGKIGGGKVALAGICGQPRGCSSIASTAAYPRQELPMIHPAAKFEFQRAIHEYGRWRAVDARARSPAAAWWWGCALAVCYEQDAVPVDWAHTLALPSGATYADAARVMLGALAEQTTLPWPDDFPQRYQHGPTDHSSGQAVLQEE